MSRWFRFYDDALNDPKVQKLPADMFRAWVNLLCLASKGGGFIQKEDVSFGLRLASEDCYGVIDYLVRQNLLVDNGDTLSPHNWSGRQFQSDKDPTNADRQKRYRDGKRNAPSNVTDNVTITPLEQSRTDTDTEKKETRAKPAYPPDFELFWKKYPTTPVMSKKQASAEWRKLPEDDKSAALAAVEPFRAWLAKQKDHPVVHACRFLSQRRFEGFKPSLEVVSSKVFVTAGTEAWDAWQSVERTPTNKDGGWYFESEYPPGYEPRAA